MNGPQRLKVSIGVIGCTGLREGAEQPGGGVKADKVESAAWEEVARAIRSEQGHLEKLELEMRR